jgi:hypothetical protein
MENEKLHWANSDESLFDDLSQLIEQSRRQVALAVNSALSFLFWQVGKLINDHILQHKRAEYGKQIVPTLSTQLEYAYGRNFNEKNIRRMMQFAQQFPSMENVVTLSRQLTWSHILNIIPLKNKEAKLFYLSASICTGLKSLFIFLFFTGFSLSVCATPIISFFNEMKGQQLAQFFSDSTIIPDLQRLNAEIRMGILDLTPERVSVIQRLNRAGIPVVAWLLLPEEEGYWFFSGNADLAFKRYSDTKKWAAANNLLFKGIGIDLELDMNDVKLMKIHPWKMGWKMFARLYHPSRLEEGRKKYAELLATIKADGYMLESYYIPFIKDETARNRTSLQRMTGILDITTEREIPMLYSSFMGNPDGLLQVYGREVHARLVAIGSTGGGVDPSLPSLTYDQLIHDLFEASSFADEVHIFSLEGCVQKGFLARLTVEQFNHPPVVNAGQVEKIKKLRKTILTLSAVLSSPNLFIAGVLLVILLLTGLLVFLIKLILRRFRKP